MSGYDPATAASPATAPNPATALGRTLVDELVRNGVRRFVIAPGSRSTALALALHAQPSARIVVAIDERSAGFHALGMAKADGIPTAVVVTSGTAVANLHPAVVEADLSRTPLLVLTADRPPELRHVSANQTIDQLGIFGTAVRWFCELGVAEDVPGANAYWRSSVCRAFADAVGAGGSAPGPVHLNLAFREPLVPASDDGRISAEPFAGPTGGRSGGRPWTVPLGATPPEVELPGDLVGAETGLVVAGTSGAGGHASAAVLADTLGWPLVAEPSSGGMPEGAVSTAHFLAAHPRFADLHRPGAVIVFGRADLSRPLQALIGDADRFVVDPWGWADPGRTARAVIRGRPVAERRAPSAWTERWRRAENTVRRALDDLLDALSEPNEPRLARDVAASVPSGGRLVVASSMPVRDLAMFMRPSGVEVFGNRGGSGIDGFVSTALGVAAGSSGPVVALAGDLSLLHDQNGFLVDRRPDCVFVVANNDGGGIFSFLPQAEHPEGFERLFGTPHGRDLGVLAALHGVHHVRVSEPEAVAGEIGRRVGEGIHLVEIRTDRARNVEIHRQLAERLTPVIDGLIGGSGA